MFQYIICVGSRSNVMGFKIIYEEFQYIICVGSRHLHFYITPSFALFQYIICVGSSSSSVSPSTFECIVSIHHMCRFKSTASVSINIFLLFQYIICVGSSFYLIGIIKHLFCFNTSYVSVQVKRVFIKG